MFFSVENECRVKPREIDLDRLLIDCSVAGDALAQLLYAKLELKRLRQTEGGPPASTWRELKRLERKLAEYGRVLAEEDLTVAEAARQMGETLGIMPRLSLDKLEQLAARYGYAYVIRTRGRQVQSKSSGR